MKHASEAALTALQPLLQDLRSLAGPVERKPGIFYLRSKAWLHFHDDAAGLFADIKLTDNGFQRYPVTTRAEQRDLWHLAQQHMRQHRSP